MVMRFGNASSVRTEQLRLYQPKIVSIIARINNFIIVSLFICFFVFLRSNGEMKNYLALSYRISSLNAFFEARLEILLFRWICKFPNDMLNYLIIPAHPGSSTLEWLYQEVVITFFVNFPFENSYCWKLLGFIVLWHYCDIVQHIASILIWIFLWLR